MLSTSVRMAIFKTTNGFFRKLHMSAASLQPRISHKAVSSEEKLKEEIDTIAEVEENLFSASSTKSVSFPQSATGKGSAANQSHTRQNPPKDAQKASRVKPIKVSSPVLVDPDLNLSYTKLSLHDPLLSKLMLTTKSKKARDRKGEIIIEGRRLILDAFNAGLKLQTVIFAQKVHLAEIKDGVSRFKEAQVIRVPQQDLRSWSTLVSCPGVIAIFRKPTEKEIEDASTLRKTFPITVVCDNVREPNNLGSIIRSCAAVPCAEVLVAKGCCDPWDTKALRGGCGAQFNVAIYDDLTWRQIYERTHSVGTSDQPLIYLAENNAGNPAKFGIGTVPYDAVQIDAESKRCVLVIGGETHGISEDAYRLLLDSRQENSNNAGGCLNIPLSEYVDSLNTASAVTLLLFEMRKKMLQESGIERRHVVT